MFVLRGTAAHIGCKHRRNSYIFLKTGAGYRQTSLTMLRQHVEVIVICARVKGKQAGWRADFGWFLEASTVHSGTDDLPWQILVRAAVNVPFQAHLSIAALELKAGYTLGPLGPGPKITAWLPVRPSARSPARLSDSLTVFQHGLVRKKTTVFKLSSLFIGFSSNSLLPVS